MEEFFMMISLFMHSSFPYTIVHGHPAAKINIKISKFLRCCD